MSEKINEHWCRVVMNETTNKIILSLDINNLDALEISGQRWANVAFKTYKNVEYPAFDICNVPEGYSNGFDIILAEQVFEHIRNPFVATKNVFDILKPNGYFLITVPFLLKVHACPSDFWRWTPAGLQAMLEDCGFFVETAGGWGNKDCVRENLKEWKWFEDGLSLENEPEFPVVCWALAKKINRE